MRAVTTHPAALTLAVGLLVIGLPLFGTPRGPQSGPRSKTTTRLVCNLPGTPISSVPYTITKPGSYHVGKNLVGRAGQAGITIASDDVTLDLNGFVLRGVPGSLEGIRFTGTRHNATIENGVVRDWGREGIAGSSANSCSLERIRADSNGLEANSSGIVLGTDSVVENCQALRNGARGIRVGGRSIVAKCAASSNVGSGVWMESYSLASDCTASNNGGAGIVSFTGVTISGCAVSWNGQSGILMNGISTITECSSVANVGYGIRGFGKTTITGCTAVQNSDVGIEGGTASTVTGCVASSNLGGGISTADHSSILACTASENLGDGISAGSWGTIKDCTASSNTRGIVFGHDSSVVGCTASSNAVDGFVTSGDGSQIVGNQAGFNQGGGGIVLSATSNRNRIEGNHVRYNSIGISVGGSTNVILRNTSSENTIYNYSIVASNRVGIIVIPTNSTVINGSTGGAGMATTDPWANFAF